MQVHGVRFVALVIESEPVSFARLDQNWVGLGKGLPVDGPVIHPAVPRKFLPENKRHHLDIPPSEAKQRVSLSSEDGVVPARAGWCGPPRRTFAVCVFHHHSQTGVPHAVVHLAENPAAWFPNGNARVISLRRASSSTSTSRGAGTRFPSRA